METFDAVKRVVKSPGIYVVTMGHATMQALVALKVPKPAAQAAARIRRICSVVTANVFPQLLPVLVRLELLAGRGVVQGRRHV